jgi:hypothetical protein
MYITNRCSTAHRTSVSVVARLQDGKLRLDSWQVHIFLPLQWYSDWFYSTCPRWLVLQWPGHEDVRSSPSITDVKNACIYTITLPYVFMQQSFIKQRDNFTFTNQNSFL